jgi:hypothetical protein
MVYPSIAPFAAIRQVAGDRLPAGAPESSAAVSESESAHILLMALGSTRWSWPSGRQRSDGQEE